MSIPIKIKYVHLCRISQSTASQTIDVFCFVFSAKTQHNVIVVDDYADDYTLICHNCYQSVDGDDCITMANISNVPKKQCDDDQLYCVVSIIVLYPYKILTDAESSIKYTCI